jgi:hypothetical protein
MQALGGVRVSLDVDMGMPASAPSWIEARR